ncbi:SGNH/GDSL hydrolase family protein [Alicyclobacillus dauci]|uniref:SGNH/GDSL hydrolase family protein n=1 Tax=Alicyclobacillus dauci TaxID=1475485 RepID=A0ABY6Z4M5_9BACL|nr:SGNH/GDSL hydrolase family protein [Alicyclobacillus dauci]WAH37603.1 SGNH/GDSL hydrolase family protein [Alicyclobacillus dauci]
MQKSVNGRNRRSHIRRSRWKKTIGYSVLGALLVAAGWSLGQTRTGHDQVLAAVPKNSLADSLNQEKVLVVGGSMAHGWKDPNDNSYLRRAFQTLSDTTNTKYTYDDHTASGDSPVKLAKTNNYESWLAKDKPQIVVISWGLLNDVYLKTPEKQLEQAVRDEIAGALKAKAVVLVVTSPVTQATATSDHNQIENYIQDELTVANSFHNSNVHFLDLNDQMTLYMQAHNQTWKQYYGDSWHPNQAGHILAGQLLANELIQTFGTGPILYQDKKQKG